jgi:hypothetical protein
MSNLNYILENLEKRKEIYIMDDLEDIVVRYNPVKEGYKNFAKFKGEKEYEISESSNVVTRADMGGTILTKEQYYSY